MEWTWYYFLIWSIIFFFPILLLLHSWRNSGISKRRLPPGPLGLPIFGYVFNLGSMPHRSLAGLQKEYGPVVLVKLGSVNTLVVQNAMSAAELFKNHDLSFADRSEPEVLFSHDYSKGAMANTQHNAYWRSLRRLGTVEMFTNKKVADTSSIRRKCVNQMIQWIEKEVKEGGGNIILKEFVLLASFNILANIMLSRDLVAPQSQIAKDYFEAIDGVTSLAGTPNVSDLFPLLKWLDLQGLRKKMDLEMGKALHIISGFVKERLKERQEGRESQKDFLDILLDFKGNGKDEPAKLSENEINVFILELFMGGTETGSSTMEWAMTELLCHPQTMIKVKAELAKVVGPSRKLEEKDIDNLHYLQAVVKEAFRLHPPLPFLVPRKATHDTNFMGYHVPKNTQVFVNVWAIGRDHEFWGADALSFKPERFLDTNVTYKGSHFGLLPFGAGRRICVGIPLAQPMLFLTLGSLLHEFDWKLDNDVTGETMDMKEKLGITARKLKPLKVKAKRVNVSST